MEFHMKRAVVAALILLAGRQASAAGQQPAANAQPKATPVGQLAFSRDRRSLAVAYDGSNTLIIWDTAAQKPIYKARAKAPIRSIAFSPTAEILAIASGTAVKLLDPKIDRVVREVDGNQGPVYSVRFFGNGGWLATGGGDGTVKLWNLGTGEATQTFSGPKGSVLSVSISPDEKWLAAACGNRDTVYIWSLEQREQKPRQLTLAAMRGRQGNQARSADVPQVIFSADSRYLAAPDRERGRISIFDVASGKEAFAFTSMNGWKCISISPDGKWLAAVASYDLPIRLVRFDHSSSDEQDQRIAYLIQQFHDDDYSKREVASERLAALGPMVVGQLQAHLDSPDVEMRVRCRRLVEQILNLANARKLEGHEAEPTRVSFSADGKLLATADSEGVVKLWTIPDIQVSATLLPGGQATKLTHENRG
jgi:WD40 repeat protein